MGRQCVLERKRRGAYHFEEDVHVFHGCLLGDAEGDCWDRSRGDGRVYVSKVQSYSVIIVIIIVIVIVIIIILIIIIAPSYLKGNLLTLKAAAAAASRSMSTMADSSDDKRRS